MNQSPIADIDVIILSMNRAADTIAAIDSAVSQTGVAKHIWVLDQGSTEETVNQLLTHADGLADVTLELLDHNLGVAGGRNRLSDMGRARIIVALDNDAVFEDAHQLRRVLDFMRANPSLGAIGFRILNYFTKQNDEKSWGYPKQIAHKFNEEFTTTRFIGAGHAIRREAFEKAGRYDDRLFFCWEEADLCYRLINLGYGIRYVPSITIYHKVSPELRVTWQGGRYYYLMRNRLYMLMKYGASPLKLLGFAVGYLVRGVMNGVLVQALRACVDAVKLYGDFRRSPDGPSSLYRLSNDAEDYIYKFDTSLRGSLWTRLRRDVLARLPATHSRSGT